MVQLRLCARVPEAADDLVQQRMNKRDISTAEPFFCMRSTPFGPVVLLWSIFDDRPRICRVLLSKPGTSAKDQISTLFGESAGRSCSEIQSVADDIEGFLNGDDIPFSLDVVRMDLCSEFQ